MERVKLNLLQRLMLLLFPRRCAVCDKIISADTLLCDACENSLPDYSGLCPGCFNKKKKCKCELSHHVYDDCFATFSYDGELEEAYKKFKFRGDVFRGEFFADSTLRIYHKHLSDKEFDFMCSVPGSHAKKDNGGYLPVQILAKQISKAVGLQYNKNILKKVKKNKTQHKLKLSERKANVRGAYLAAEKIYGKRILLFDDIRTTGSTLDECTRELKFAGADEVTVLTVFAPSLEYGNHRNDEKSQTKIVCR